MHILQGRALHEACCYLSVPRVAVVSSMTSSCDSSENESLQVPCLRVSGDEGVCCVRFHLGLWVLIDQGMPFMFYLDVGSKESGIIAAGFYFCSDSIFRNFS